MILYFSATGNSEAVARLLSEKLYDCSYDIAEIYNNDDFLNAISKETDILGFVFPVYGWNIPCIIINFMKKIAGITTNVKYCFYTITCGDDVGMIDKQIKKTANKANLPCNAIFSVTMPNTYVCLPGFDIDDEKTTNKKLLNYPKQVEQIANIIKSRKKITLVNHGNFPYIKTYILGFLFKKFLIDDNFFFTNTDCTHCKTCIKVCPVKNISITSRNTLKWNKLCIGCLSCYHHCPTRAIRYSIFTKNKGQYLFKKHINK